MEISIAGEAVTLLDGEAVIEIPRDEIVAVSVYAVDTIVRGVAKYAVVEQSHGDSIEVCDTTEGFAAFIDALPTLLGFDGALLRDALARANPEADAIVVLDRA